MPPYRKILCAAGNGLSSEAALSYAVQLMSRTRGHVDAVHALALPRLSTPRPVTSANDLRRWREANEDLAARIARAVPDLGLPGARVTVTAHVISGTLPHAIRWVAETEGSDLVVLSRSTLEGLHDLAMGDDLHELLHDRAPPLLVVPDGRAQRIMLPTSRALRVLAQVTSSRPLSSSPAALFEPTVAVAEGLSEVLGGELLLGDVGERFSLGALCSLVERAQPDLLVVEEPQEGRLTRFLHAHGAVERLVARAEVPVLVLPKPSRTTALSPASSRSSSFWPGPFAALRPSAWRPSSWSTWRPTSPPSSSSRSSSPSRPSSPSSSPPHA